MMKPTCSSDSANFSRKMAVALSATTSLLIAALVASGYASVGAGWQRYSVSPKTPVVASQNNITGDDLEAELITILPGGFEPGEITRAAGAFILAIDNRSGLEEIELRLEQAQGQRIHTVRMRKEKPDVRQIIELRPGAYKLTAVKHSDWICRVTITER